MPNCPIKVIHALWFAIIFTIRIRKTIEREKNRALRHTFTRPSNVVVVLSERARNFACLPTLNERVRQQQQRRWLLATTVAERHINQREHL